MRKLFINFVLLAAGLLIGTQSWAGNVAKIGTQEYATLKDAVDAVQTGETIVLIGNLEASTSTSATAITIDKEGVAFTLDLNGQHITGGKNTTSYGTMRIENGDITIMDSQTGGYIGKSGADKVPVCIIGGSVTLNSGTINGYQYGVNNGSAGTFTMNGGSINVSYTSHAYGVYTYGKVTINGGFISATNTGTSTSAKAYAVSGSTSAAPFINIFGGYFHSSARKETGDIENATFIGGGKFSRGCVCPDGYKIEDITETIGSITYKKQVVPVSPSTVVAEVGSTQYNSFLEALAKAPNNSTIRLLDNVTLSQYLFFPTETTLTLDLNNNKLTFANCLGTTSSSYGRIQVGGNLTITDNSLAQNGSIISKESTSTEYCVLVLAGGSLTLEGGTIDVETTGKSAGIYAITNNGNVLMTGGTLKGKNTTASFAGNVLMLNTASADGSAIMTGGNIHIKVPTDTQLKTSNTFNFAKKIEVKGGVFTREGASIKLDSDLFGVESSIIGGQFNFDPSAYVPVGDKIVTSTGTETITPFEDAQILTYAVVTNPNPVMRVENINTGVQYASPQEAVDAANEGEELQLLETIDLGQASLVFSKGIIFDLNGKMLQSSSASTIKIQGGTETYPVTIVDKAEVKGKIIGQKCIHLVNAASHVVARDIVIEASSAQNYEAFCLTDEAGDSYVSLERVKGTITSSSDKPNSGSAIVGSRKNTTVTLKDCDFLIDYPYAVSTTSSTTVHSIVYTNNSNFTIVVDGGTYRTNVKSAKANILSYCSNGYLATIYGGNFSINATNPDANTVIAFYGSGGANDKLLIKGGYFTMDPKTWVVSTHGTVDSDNPNYQYKVVEQDAASVAGVIYGSVQEAVDAVIANPSLGAITLLRNVTISNTLELPASVTFAATAYTMTLNGSPAIILQSGATLPTCLSVPMQVSAQKSGKTYYYAKFYDGYASNSSIKLETNVIYDNVLALNDKGTKTIDLNGYNLTGNQSYSLINVWYNRGYSVLNLINTASQESVIENIDVSEDAHVIDISSYAVSPIAAGSYAKVTIGDNVKIKGENGVYIWDEGSSLDVQGSIESERYAIAGNGTSQHWGTTTHIYEGANIKSIGNHAIYHPQDGTLIIDGGTIEGYSSAVEIRAGVLNINGGSLTSTYDGFVCDRNGNGTTTKGAALAIAQHTTKQPITVNISGGHFKGNYPISQCNPQENEAEYVALLDIEVTGGYFWADNETSIISHTEDRRLFLKGGVYNLDPAAFTVNGYFSLTNQPELYAGSYAQGYEFKVAQQEITNTETKEEGTTDWAQTTTWTTDIVPDYATNVTVGKDIVVTTPAEANKVTIENGKTLTVKDGGTLIIGNGGIVGATAQTFKVENGGQVLIAPNAENATLKGSVDLLADRAGLKPGVSSYTGQGSEMYWQHIAIPTQGAPESITPSVQNVTFFNTWDIMKGWQNVGKAALNQSFKGYNLGNFHPYSSDGSASVVYTFVGQLVGNQPDYMVFAREGHSFFGNSYLAPLDVATMFGTLYNPELEYTLNIYDSQTEMYQPVNEATYAILGITEIKPLQGFFIYAQNATQAQLDYNSAVYTAYLNKHATGGQTSAPARKVANTNTYDKMAQIIVAATTGEKDAIYLFEDAQFSDAEDNGFDARNLEHSGLDMSIAGSYADLSVLATDNLEGALLNINTTNAVEYTMTFSHIQGNMTLTDNVTGAVIAMEEGATYTFAAQPNAQLNGRFAVNAVRTMPTNNERITINPAAKGVYTMMGQYVGETANWHALPAGVYVVDGVRVSK